MRVFIDERLLLDAGAVSRKLGPEEQRRITHILLSHAHLDHIKSIPFLMDNMVASNNGLAYTGDTGPTEELWESMNGRKVDALIIELSFPDELAKVALASGHLTPSMLKIEL